MIKTDIEVLNKLKDRLIKSGELDKVDDDCIALAHAIEALNKLQDIKLPKEALGKMVMFIRRSYFVPETNKLEGLNQLISELLITYLKGGGGK